MGVYGSIVLQSHRFDRDNKTYYFLVMDGSTRLITFIINAFVLIFLTFQSQKNIFKRMNFHRYLKSYSTAFVMSLLVLSLYSCKTKKIAQAAPVTETTTVEKAKAEPMPETAIEKEEETAAPEKISYDFKTIQFEFNSSVLKTFSYPVLDQIAKAMKKDPSVKFNVDGHSSAEGTVERNQTLSTDRANSVKSYLVSSGVSASTLIATGYGESKPLTDNSTEAGKAQNRRVEISKAE
ncbi:MAG: hypothetical protein JWQ25_828 [Daejeonella sp.]|nr:hypothetical protein [Daejeonella sp.]